MQTFINNLDAALNGKRAILPGQTITSNNHARVLIEDSKEHGRSVFRTYNSVSRDYKAARCFEIQNRNNWDVILWAIDGGFAPVGTALSGQFPQKCDAAFGVTNRICFVEFKTEANPEAHPETIRQNRKGARDQLASTIDYLKVVLNIGPQFRIPNYFIEAYIVTPPAYPRKGTGITSLAIKFLQDYGVPLFETQNKEFE